MLIPSLKTCAPPPPPMQPLTSGPPHPPLLPNPPHKHLIHSPQVLDTCLGAGVPVAGYVGGGYHADLEVLARRHCWLHRAAAELWRDHELS